MTTFEQPTLTLPIAVTLRIASRHDLPKMEWFGQYAHFRNLFRRAFREQLQGRRVILLADYNSFPIGHVFVQFKSSNERTADGVDRAYFYSFRVMEMFRGQGIGTWLMQEAENMLLDRGMQFATIAVAKDNIRALRLYDRLGYRKFADDPGRWSYMNHNGEVINVNEPCWILEKNLKVR